MKRAKMALGHKTALSAAMVAVFLVSIMFMEQAAADYYYLYYGDPPSGGGIFNPTGSWGTGLGPQSGWGWDDQCVVWAYGIQLQAMMYPPFVDRDELWYWDEELQESRFVEDRWDEPSSPTLFSWMAWPALGYITMNTPGTNGTFQPTGLPLGTTSTQVIIEALIDDRPLANCYDDDSVTAYDPPCVSVTIFDTHLSRDQTNRGQLNVFPESSAASCMMAANHAWDGDTSPSTPIRPPWGWGGMWWAIYDSTGYLATDNPAEINFSLVKRGDVVIYETDVKNERGFVRRHIETFVKNGTDGTWGTNTAVSVPGSWWCHSSVVGYICHYFSDPLHENCDMIVYQHCP